MDFEEGKIYCLNFMKDGNPVWILIKITGLSSFTEKGVVFYLLLAETKDAGDVLLGKKNNLNLPFRQVVLAPKKGILSRLWIKRNCKEIEEVPLINMPLYVGDNSTKYLEDILKKGDEIKL